MHYETITGSEAYAVHNADSDRDVIGFCIPTKDMVFPHLAGEIQGFGRQPKRFDEFRAEGVADPDTGKKTDIVIYGIVKFFQLCMDNNPNMVDALFTSQRCVLHTTAVGNMVRENRRIFLHRGAWHKFKGYAFSQLNKAEHGEKRDGKRKELFEKYGCDVKFLYHVVRLTDEIEQILSTGDLDLERSSEHLKKIRRGEVPLSEVKEWFGAKEKYLERLYEESKLPWGPDEQKIKALLVSCLEHHYGSLSNAVAPQDVHRTALREIDEIMAKVRQSL